MPLDIGRLAVFPIHEIDEAGRCGCGDVGCDDVGKHPMLPFGSLGVAEKWGGTENCGFGIATGTRSGVFVVDLDVKPEKGIDGIAAIRTMGHLPPTYTVRTPTGGLHIYFQLPDGLAVKNSRSALGPGIDIRGEGGYVVAQGSPHRNGGIYKVALDAPIAPAPAWLLEWPGLRGSAGAVSSSDPGDYAPIPLDRDHPDYERRIGIAREYLATCPPAISGEGGHDALWPVGLKLVRELQLPLDVCHALVAELYNPRCSPPWSDWEINHKLEDARDRSTRVPGIAPPTWSETVTELGKPPGLRDLPKEPDTKRRTHRAGHDYLFTPGEGAASSELRKTPSAEIAFLLSAHEHWQGVLQWDEYRRRIWAVDPPVKLDCESDRGISNADISHVRMWLQTVGIAATKEDVMDSMMAAARRCSFHPIKEYLESCRNQRRPGILDHAAAVIFGADDKLSNLFFRRMMISAVRRIYQPGCQVDTIFVIHGPQGYRKSTLIRVLFGPDFTRSQMPDLATKEASNALRGRWGIELAELDRVLRAENSTVKEFLSRVSDDYRRAYEVDDMKFPRECVLIGTVNDDAFLRDATGNRRFHPITVKRPIDIDWVEQFRDALWAEALYLAEQGERHWLDADEEKEAELARDQFVMQDAWHDSIRDYLRGRDYVTTEEVYENVIARGTTDKTKYGRSEQLRIADTLKRLGCQSTKSGGKRRWKVSEELVNLDKVDIARRFADSILAN